MTASSPVVLSFYGCFWMGLGEKEVFRYGFWVVKTWWDMWLMWCFNPVFAEAEKYATFSNYFFVPAKNLCVG
ncbi:hypothetical protein [Tunturibacter empetritectus]|uniref:Uncharacterized protein n=1 Tax=Tunturiibacter empetritectus TaxID=3069691 RepID=A0A7W8ILE5_9BACT|nr:hypothetical protein [Edaphobacter lichenicola]MBB5318308.1 hypothetical protein [Edaphobacter lichenicola]